MLFKSNGKPTLWFTCTLDVLQEWIKNQTILLVSDPKLWMNFRPNS